MHHPTRGRRDAARTPLSFLPGAISNAGHTVAGYLPVAAALLAFLPAAASAAAGPGSDLGRFEVAGPVVAAPTRAPLPAPSTSASSSPRSAARQAALRADAASLGLNVRSLPPAHATSFGFGPDALAAVDPAAASLETVREHPALFGVEPEGLELLAVRETPKMTYVHFRQVVAGFPVMHSRARFNWDSENRLAMTRADVFVSLSEVEQDMRRNVTWIDVTAARAGALAGMPADLEVSGWEFEEQAWLPLANEATRGGSPDVEDGAAGHRLVPVWNVRFRTEDPVGWWDTVIDAETGALLSRTNRVHWETVSGVIEGRVEPASPGDPQVDVIMPHAEVELFDGDEMVAAGFSDAEGGFSLDAPEGDHTLATHLKGRYIWVRNLSLESSTPRQDVDVFSSLTRVDWSDENSWVSERDAYYHGTVARDFVRALDQTSGMIPLDSPMRTEIENPTGSCNAFWDGVRMSFYAAGGGCPSTARIADVVYHEYGHAVTQFLYWPSFGPSDIHEGMSDYLAATMTDQPFIGRGFFGPGTSIRDIETDLIWPDDRHADPHIQGLILAGAFWDLRKVLGREYTDELAHFARYGGPRTFDDYLLDVLAYDDDDADLSTGTPNWEAIVDAFASHGIGDFTVHILAPLLPDLEQSDGTIDVTLRIWSLLGLDEGEAALYYQTDGMASFRRLALQPTGQTREYQVSIPTPPLESRVYYYWSASDTSGHRSYLPEGAPDETFSFYYGVDRIAPVVSHYPHDAIPADFGDLYLRAGVTDNSQEVTDFHAVYRQGPVQETTIEMEAREDGTHEAWLDLNGPSVGDVVTYRLVARDGAAQPNEGAAPREGDFTVSVRQGIGSNLETDDGGLVGAGDWEWGTPDDPALSFSGSKVWATRLEGTYTDSRFSALEWGPFDLTSFGRARLQFDHLYKFERGFDGGAVQVSTNGGTTWTVLTPQDGYTHPTIAGLNPTGSPLPGYSGESAGWERAGFPLDRYLNQADLRIRFLAGADPYVTDLGWYLDDVMLVAAQARADAVGFGAQDGMDERVELAWQSPRGINPSSGRFFGFNLYRGLGADAIDLVRLNDAPLTGFSYVDDQVQNGSTYLYRLTAVYDEGESRGVTDTGSPFAATVRVDVDEVNQVVNDYAPASTSIRVSNIGPGILRYEVFLADIEQELDDVMLTYRIPPWEETEFERVWTDREDASVAVPDIRAIEARRWVDAGNPMIEFKILGYEPWGDPVRDWGGVLLFDTDRNVEETQALDFGWGEGLNLGFEFGVVFGVIPSQADLGDVTAAFFDASLSQQPEPLERINFPADADSLSFSVPFSYFVDVAEMRVGLVTARGLGMEPTDWAPERPVAPWLERSPRGGTATSAGASVFDLAFDPDGLPNGRYDASALLISNDELNPSLTIPITLYVDRALPDELAELAFASSLAGMEMSFQFRSEVVPDSVSVERRSNGGDWVDVTVQPDGDTPGAYRLLDRGLVPGERYFYRVFVRSFDGRTKLYGPSASTYDPVIPELAAPAFASEIRGLLLSFESSLGTSAHVWRAPKGGEFLRLTEDPLLPDPEGRFEYLDGSVESGLSYQYRFDVTLDETLEVSYGPFDAVFDRPQPELQDLDVASEEEGVRVAFRLPDVLVDAARVLVERAPQSSDDWLVVGAFEPEAEPAQGSETGSSPVSVDLLDRWLRGDEGEGEVGVLEGEPYRYRIAVELPDAPPFVYGPYEVTFEPPVPQVVKLHAGRPNPFQRDVLLRLDLPERMEVRVEIFDASGRLRATVMDGARGPGIERFLWNGRDSAGESLPSGVYWARLRTPVKSETIRLVRTK